MKLITKLYDTSICLKEAAAMMRLSYADTPHTDELEGAARMIESWIIEIGRENETKHRG